MSLSISLSMRFDLLIEDNKIQTYDQSSWLNLQKNLLLISSFLILVCDGLKRLTNSLLSPFNGLNAMLRRRNATSGVQTRVMRPPLLPFTISYQVNSLLVAMHRPGIDQSSLPRGREITIVHVTRQLKNYNQVVMDSFLM